MAELSSVLTAAGGMKVFINEYDSNATYPLTTPPGDMPCLVLTVDTTGSTPSFYYSYFYFVADAQTVILETGWYSAGGS